MVLEQKVLFSSSSFWEDEGKERREASVRRLGYEIHLWGDSILAGGSLQILCGQACLSS